MRQDEIKDKSEEFRDDELAMYLPFIIIRDGEPCLNHGDGLVTRVTVDDAVPDLDPDYIVRADLDRFILDAIKRGRRLLAVGEAGSGKSTAIEQICARLGYPMRRVNLSGETSVSDLTGSYVVQNRSTVYLEGVLPQAMRRGQILLLDEIDAAQPEILFVLQSVLEGGPLFLAETGETIRPHRDFRLFATANSIGDETGLYAGTRAQNASTLDRWDLVLRVGYPTPAEEAVLVERRTGLVATITQRFVEVFTALRDAAKRGDLAGPFSTRRLVAFADCYKQYRDQHVALSLALTNRMSPTERTVVEEIVRRHLGADPVIGEVSRDP